MPYAIRDANGKLVQVFDPPVTSKSELVSTGSEDYQRFIDESDII